MPIFRKLPKPLINDNNFAVVGHKGDETWSVGPSLVDTDGMVKDPKEAYEPCLSPHDGTPMDQCPVKAGDLILFHSPSSDETQYQRIFPGFIGRVVSDEIHFPHHMSHGWLFWVESVHLPCGITMRVISWEPEKMRSITEEKAHLLAFFL